MRLCDKCGKKLREGDWNSNIKLAPEFTYDLCLECEQKFLLHVDSFFNQSNEADK